MVDGTESVYPESLQRDEGETGIPEYRNRIGFWGFVDLLGCCDLLSSYETNNVLG